MNGIKVKDIIKLSLFFITSFIIIYIFNFTLFGFIVNSRSPIKSRMLNELLAFLYQN